MKRYKWRKILALVILAAAFGQTASAATSLSDLNVYPNPARVYNGESTITFNNLTAQVKILILDANAHIVREVELDNSGSIYVWDLTNNEGSKVASGVYVYVVGNNAGEKRRGKVAILR